ncbi:MAG TPA: extracellular solute-binding protein [Opitutaceae bacterium]|nr:extracellular solute-binding protein [Opitutaceae bacterium]
MADGPIRLRGIAWDHSRGFTPMVATAQRYGELHPGIQVTWEKRSLQAFADAPLAALAAEFDLLVIDHPFAGDLAQKPELVLDQNRHAPAALLAELAAQAVGASHASYAYDGRRCALPIDAAAPVSGWREDLLARHGLRPPTTWEELLELANHGFVAVAGIPVDCLMSFFMFCQAQGEVPCATRERVVARDIGAAALAQQRDLMRRLPAETWERNPIRTWDALAAAVDRPAICPFAYGYSNYARPGYAGHVLRFGGLVTFRGRRLRATLGGTGLAVSARCRHPEAALDYAARVAGADWQRTLYFDAGGQPAHRSAWTDEEVNRRSNGFFRDTLATLDEAWVRPRYPGYLDFQDHGGEIVRDFLLGRSHADAALAALDRAYRESLTPNP